MNWGVSILITIVILLVVYEVIKIAVRDGILEAEKKLENRRGENNHEK